MKILTTPSPLLLSIVSVFLPLSAVYAQEAPTKGHSGTLTVKGLPIVGSLTRNRVGSFSPALLEAERKANDAIARGEAFMQLGASNAAIAAYQEALSYEPNNGLAYQRLAEAQTAAGQTGEAAATYRTLLYKWPGKSWSGSQNGDPSVHMQFALVLLKAGQRDEALSVYQQGYQLLQTELWDGGTGKIDDRPLPPLFAKSSFDPVQFAASAYTVIGIHKHEWMDRDAPDFQRAIQLQPTLATAYFYRGLSLKYKLGRASDALAAFAQASKLGGKQMQPFVDKGMEEGTSEFRAAVKKVRQDTR